MAKVKWALVGTSRFAVDWIGRGIQEGENSELTAVVSRDGNRAKEVAERVGAPLHYSSIEEIDTNEVDGVAVVTPNPQHAPLSIAAAERGLHVIVEKPMAPTLEECEAMIEAARKSGVVLAVAHCMHWAPPVARARELVSQGEIGKVIDATIGSSFNSPPSGVWRQTDRTEDGGGPLFDMGVHAIDTIQSIVGPVARVAAFLDHHVYDYNADDTTSTLLRFESGAHGVMQSNFNCGQNNLEIKGTKGTLRSGAWLGREFSGDLTLEKDGQATPQDLPTLLLYKAQIEHVSECVQEGKTPVISGERGLRNVAVLRAAIESARSGSTVDVRV